MSVSGVIFLGDTEPVAGRVRSEPGHARSGSDFIAIFLVAAATVLLMLDLSRRVRRTRYRGEIRESSRLSGWRKRRSGSRTARTRRGPGPLTGALDGRRGRNDEIAVQWQRNASTVRAWKISWKPKRPGNGLGRFIAVDDRADGVEQRRR